MSRSWFSVLPLAAIALWAPRAGDVAPPPAYPAAFCWSPGTPEAMIRSYQADIFGEGSSLSPTSAEFAFDDSERWHVTATDGSGLVRGQPTNLTWGIVPDGTIADGQASHLISTLDALYGAGQGGSDLTQRPWFRLFQKVFDDWAAVCGIRYVYEPNDDQAAFPDSPGLLGVRPDVRIGGHSVDGASGDNILGYNFFPDEGDMVLDTDNVNQLANLSYDSRTLRNLVGHEHGHGIGLGHSCPIDQTKLMEATITTAFDGPQHDDILGANRGYGDRLEHPSKNDAPGTATDLGALSSGDTVRVTGVSIDDRTDHDWYAFTLPQRMRVSVIMDPVGQLYQNVGGGPYGCDPPTLLPFNSQIMGHIGFDLVAPDGNEVLSQQNYLPLGFTESVDYFLLERGAGTYFVHVYGDSQKVQMYDLSIAISAGQPPVAICKDVTACQGSVNVNRFNNGSYDPDDDPLTFTVTPEPPYPPGMTQVRMVVSDGVLADTCSATITVDQPPTAVAQNVTVAGDTLNGCQATVDAGEVDAGSSDPDADSLSYYLAPPGPYGPGDHPVMLVVTDGCGQADTASATITVTCAVPVRLLSLGVERTGDGATVSWSVADAVDHLGFYVDREDPVGTRARLTDRLLSGRTEYTFVDPDPPAGEARYWLEEISRSGGVTWYGPAILPAATTPVGTWLAVEPNPFRGATSASFSLASAGKVRVDVLDVRGRRVSTLADEFRGGGRYRVSWDGRTEDGRAAAAGLYLVRLSTPDVVLVKKAFLVR